mgnify:FL=1
MLALAATITGLIITGYSAYKIQDARRGEGRKLRDMEVLRRLNVPPKKQVRAWGFLLALGLVLLSPGLGFLLSCDQTTSDGGVGECSNLRATPSGSPIMAPPSEKLDKTPRTFDDDGSNGRTVTIGGSSGGGGGGGKKASSSGGKTTSSTTSTETTTNSGDVPDDKASYSGGGGSTSRVSDAEETPVIYKADPASDLPLTGTDSEEGVMEEADESEMKTGEQASPTRPQNDGDESERPAEMTSSDGGSELPVASIEAEAAAPEASKEYVAVGNPDDYVSGGNLPNDDVHADDDVDVLGGDLLDEGVPVQSDIRMDENPLKPDWTETESATIDAAREKRSAPNASRQTAAESLAGSSSAEVLMDQVVLDTGPEESTLRAGFESAEIGSEFQATSDLSDSEFERELPKAAAPPSEGIDPAEAAAGNDSEGEGGAMSSITNPAEETGPEIGLLETNATIDEGKKLEFNTEMAGSGNAYPSGNNSSSKLEGASNESGEEPELEVFSQMLDFDEEFENFASFTQPEKGIERNYTSSSVTRMEFEKIDLGSDRRGGLGLTPTSPV